MKQQQQTYFVAMDITLCTFVCPQTLAVRYGNKLDRVELRFMESLLAIDPKLRLTGRQCLDHEYCRS